MTRIHTYKPRDDARIEAMLFTYGAADKAVGAVR